MLYLFGVFLYWLKNKIMDEILKFLPFKIEDYRYTDCEYVKDNKNDYFMIVYFARFYLLNVT